MPRYFNCSPKRGLYSFFDLSIFRLVLKPKFISSLTRRHILLRVSLLTLLYFFCFPHNLARANPLIDYFKGSIKLTIAEKEKTYLNQLKKLNKLIQQELAQGRRITDVLNRIQQENLEKNVLTNFFNIINLRKDHNDQIDKRMEQREYKDNSEKGQMRKAYQLLKIDLVPNDIKKLVYLYPILIPLANYVQPGSIKISDADKDWFKNDINFRFCFFYLYRKFAHLDKTRKSYALLCRKIKISPPRNDLLRLSNLFNHDLGFEFFDDKFDTGVYNKESKFFGFDGYTYKYLKNEQHVGRDQPLLIKTFKTYCVYNEYCNGCDLLGFYNERKLGMFNDLTLEMEHSLTYNNVEALDSYIKLLYYLSRTFPNLSAFTLTHRDGKYKFTDHQEKSPVLERLKSVWKEIEAKQKDPAKATRMLKYTLGSIYLLPQKGIFVADEEYDFDRSGYATYMQEYITIYNKYQPSSK